ncbi:MAG TPA: hypothetical protein VK427_10925 [Kofleriaceae bacterium]|nr:hypothetical protein [Kofleriaceae bacterium]
MRLALVCVLCAACGGSSKSSTTPKETGPTCDAAATAILSPVSQDKEQTDAMLQKREELTTFVRTRCTDDRWSADARRCFASVQATADVERCASLLTPAQVDAFSAAFGAPPPPTPTDAETQAPKKSSPPAKSRKPGDPCDGGE